MSVNGLYQCITRLFLAYSVKVDCKSNDTAKHTVYFRYLTIINGKAQAKRHKTNDLFCHSDDLQ